MRMGALGKLEHRVYNCRKGVAIIDVEGFYTLFAPLAQIFHDRYFIAIDLPLYIGLARTAGE